MVIGENAPNCYYLRGCVLEQWRAVDERLQEAGRVLDRLLCRWASKAGAHRARTSAWPKTVLRKRKVEIAEGKFLEKKRPVTTTFEELAEAYWQWIRPDEVVGVPARKRSWKSSDRYALGRLRDFFGSTPLTAVTPALIEQYRAWRRATISRHHRPIRPATVNRELECLKRMFNVARRGLLVLKGGAPAENPVAFVSKEREHNERDRVLVPRGVCAGGRGRRGVAEADPAGGVSHRHAPGGDPLAALGPSGCPAAASPAQIGRHQDGGRAGHPVEWGVDSCAAIGYNIPRVSLGVRQP